MNLVEFFSSEIDDITDSDIENAYFMRSLLDDTNYEVKKVPKASVIESVVKALATFDGYKSLPLNEEIQIMKRNVHYLTKRRASYDFDTSLDIENSNEVVPTIIYPQTLDKTSYAFLGHEFHHALKDVHCKERKMRDRLAEVIPMFYEMMCADSENNELVAKEIFKRRLILMNREREENPEEMARQMQYFNSYYYALALFNRYGKDELLVLRLISRVLIGEISTLDMLSMLDIYDNNMDYTVSRELEMIKGYIHK